MSSVRNPGKLGQIGLALSGGGLRAAVFHSGVLHRLARDQQLEKVSFLSTVSGASLGIALLYGLNNGSWPDSKIYINEVLPSFRRLLTNVNLQHALYTRCMFKFWKVTFGRANLLAETIRDEWDINLSLKDLPETPRWLISTTCYETGKNWRFDKERFGDYQFGYVVNPDFDVADAVAASAALPMLIGSFELDTSHYSWMKFTGFTDDKMVAVDPMFNRVHLWDGGIYENLGLESLFKVGSGPREGVDFLIVSDAGAPLRTHQNRRQALLRLADICTSQSRGLRARIVVNHFMNHPDSGVYFQMGNTAREIIQKSKVKLKFNINWHTTLPAEQVAVLKDIPTHIKRFSETEFDQLHQHGYEVADTTLFCYSPSSYSHIPYG